jgi:uncharacterized damage-inducible protein DinB
MPRNTFPACQSGSEPVWEGEMFNHLEDFAKTWEYESAATQKLMDQLNDRSLGQAVADGHRNLGRVAWHLVTAIPEMMSRTGLKFQAVEGGTALPATAQEIKKGYADASRELLEQIKSHWTDASLAIEDDMYGFKWSRSQTLRALVYHQVHHRGQMTVLMRQAGLPVPGVYGPSKEEWSNFGGTAPEV